MYILLVPALLLAAAQAQPCSFPISLNDTEIWGLHQSLPGGASPAACAAACCANSTCQVYQWCAPGGACSPAGTCWVGALGGSQQPVSGWVSARRALPLVLDASAPPPVPAAIPGLPPVQRADGSTLGVTTGGFLLNGAPLFAVAGEMHYSRVAQAAWGADLRAMRAGGLTTVSAYVIMIHHNEQQGVYDWSGQRNLTDFLRQAAAAGLLVSLRIGPYCHGEVRGGGLPDWLQAVPGLRLRTDQPEFMAYVSAWYSAIAQQVQGLMWQQGGPVITMQLDNESGDAAYLMACRAAAVAAGLAPPFFAATGNNKVPLGSMLPLAGMYPVIFWDCSSASNSTSADYLFQRPDFEGSGYPTLWCELGGGMASVFCARHRIAPMDIVASAYVAAARSSDIGYYMFHGGENPKGRLSTLQERQQYYNGIWDLPVTGYDFVAPLAASGAAHLHFHSLRALHALTAACPWLATAATALPTALPSGATDASTLRWAARHDGATGATLLFFSTYARNLPMAPPQAARLTVLLPGAASLSVPQPSSPALALPAGQAWAWPLYPPLPAALRLRYALAQPAGTVPTPGGPALLLLATPGVPTELCLEGAEQLTVLQCSGVCSVEAEGGGGAGKLLLARGLPSGRGAALVLLAADGRTRVTFVVLSPEDAGRLWVGRVAGQLRAVLTTPGDSSLVELGEDADSGSSGVVRVRTEAQGGAVALSVLPAPSQLSVRGGSGGAVTPTPDGLFSLFALPVPPCSVAASVVQLSAGSLPPPAPLGPRGYPTAPGNDGTLSDPSWAAAAVWQVSVSGQGAQGGQGVDVRLRTNWTGSVARLYSVPDGNASLSALVGDVFFNNADTPETLWSLSLTRALPPSTAVAGQYTLRVVPLRADASASIALDSWPAFGTGPGGSALSVSSVQAVCTVTLTVDAVA